jgi:hypothetical protein
MLETRTKRWEMELYEKGFKKGFEKGLEMVVLKLLRQGISLLSISSLTGFSYYKINLVKKKYLCPKR